VRKREGREKERKCDEKDGSSRRYIEGGRRVVGRSQEGKKAKKMGKKSPGEGRSGGGCHVEERRSVGSQDTAPPRDLRQCGVVW